MIADLQHDHDIKFVSNLDQFEKKLHMNLENRKNAVKNWKKLRLLIVLLIICGKSYDCDKLEDDRNLEDEVKKPRLVERIAPYIIHPKRPKKLLFDLIIGIFFLISYLVDPFIFAFYYEPYEYTSIQNLQMVLCSVFLINGFVTIFTGVKREDHVIEDLDEYSRLGKQEKKEKEIENDLRRKKLDALKSQIAGNLGNIDDPTLHRDCCYLLGNYFKRDGIFDLLANLPLLLYTAIMIYGKDDWHIWDVYETWQFQWCYNLVFLRLYNVKRVATSLYIIFEDLQEVFYTYRYSLSNICQWTISALYLVGFIHYFACGWIYVANRKKMIGYGHFHEFSDWESFFIRYAESWYTMTTTISTVGYGDYKGYYDDDGHWAVEMTYLYFVIITGLILFSLVTEMIFSYKSMLTLQDIMTSKAKGMEIFMYEVSLRRKDKVMPMDKIN